MNTKEIPNPGIPIRRRDNIPGTAATEQASTLHSPSNVTAGKQRVNYRGAISILHPSNITLALDDGSLVNIGMKADTRIEIPSLHGASSANLQAGMLVLVQAVSDENGNFTARSILVIPGKPTLMHRIGWITDYQPGISITVHAYDGNFYTFALAGDAKVLPVDRIGQLMIGSLATVIAPRDPATLGRTAQEIIVHPTTANPILPETPTTVP